MLDLVTADLDYPKYPTIWQPLSDYPTIPTIGRPPNCRELSASRRDQAVSSPACARLNSNDKNSKNRDNNNNNNNDNVLSVNIIESMAWSNDF